MQNPLLAKKNEQDSYKMSNSNSRGNMAHLYAQMQHKKMEEANEAVKLMMEDPDLFDYDGQYDQIKKAREEATQVKKTEKKESVLLGIRMAAKDKRDREFLIRQERLAEKEINRTGNEGLKEERFITSSYKKMLEENKKFLEDDDKKEQLNEKNSALQKGSLDSFFQKQLAGLNGRVDITKMIDKNKQRDNKQEKEQTQQLQYQKPQAHQQRSFNQEQEQKSDRNIEQIQVKQDSRPKLSELYSRMGQPNQPVREDQYQREGDSKSQQNRDKVENYKDHKSKRDRRDSKSRSSSRDRNKYHRRERSRSKDRKESRKDRHRSRSYDKKNKDDNSSRREPSDKINPQGGQQEISQEKQVIQKSVKVEEPKLSKEEKIRLAKERFLQRQQQQQKPE
ncbi:hypothetical protein TTHERM_01104950 (macronuclear) [Tetrahymena thermophila SB210]|uniref:Nuclear speckle splicing regulatory protein 1 N-terminal domain-containing protein n=1 Tax=Tetrahymena thermophila (strain SB210) TaxID=312017 RepID=Q24D64_TETTS|nr:hypothetical protein TTHERM_01104950 [Tetrahymena thermophila SB210]EAS05725.4 hypothetical protein TTHERM_01104950 [Tetrahymena thermophila SB210]|eukprot:XP_001025970.4 hypothetical protein TTHERM_01104950 [Tetrahymena thermophila SB210]